MGNQLHLACWRDDIQTFEKVINFAPGGLKSLDVFGVQPLHVATFKGSLKCLSVILERQIHGDLDDTFGGGITAFQIAEDASQSFAWSLLNYQKGEDHALHIFKLDLYNLGIFDYKQSYVYHECLKYETKASKEGILKCIPPGGDINAPLVKGLTHFTPLFLSVILNDSKGVKKLLARGAIKDTALSHNNLLCLAARYGYYQLIPILIDAGFSISHGPGAYTPLAVAAQYGSLPCVKAITTRKEYDPTTAGADKALFLTAQNGHFHIISTLVHAGATVNEMYYSDHCKLPLHSASLYDHRATVEKLLEFGANPLSCNKSLHPLCTCTALSYAAEVGSCNVVEPLIKAGVSPTKYCEVPSHLSPVVKANIRGFVSFLKVVVDCGFNPNSLGSKGHTPLEDALNFRFEERQKGRPPPLSSRHLELLIDLGCTVDGRNNSSGFEAIHMAAQYNDIEAIKALLKSGVSPNIGTKSESPFTPIHIAAIHNRPEAIQILVDAGANLNTAYTDGAPPLHVAVQFEAINSCKKLLELGANPNTGSTIGMTPLHVAAGSDQADMVELLFRYGAHLAAVFVGTEPRSHNAQSNSLWLERCLYPHPDNCALTPLIVAARFQARSALKKLIELGADVDAQYGHWTPLFAAAVLGFVDIVSDLLNNGANVDKGNTSGTTPLHAAITNCHTEVACILIQRGCDVTQPILQHDKKTPDLNPFQLASLFCQTEILRIIHEKNPNINIHESSHDHLGLLHLALLQPTTEITLPTGPEPNYPLIKATNEEYMKKEEQTVRYLLELGCNVNATDDKGMTPLDMATSYEAEKIAMILVKAGGKRGEHIKDEEELRRHIARLEGRDRDILHRLSAVESQVKDLQDFKASTTQLMEGVLSKCSYVSDEISIKSFLQLPHGNFMKDAGAKEVASELRRRKVIPESVETEIERALDKKIANGLLYDHLCAQGTFQTLEIVCDVFIGEQGYPRMNQLGERMKEKLRSSNQQSSVTNPQSSVTSSSSTGLVHEYTGASAVHDEPVVKKPTKDLKLVNLMPYVKELASEGTVIAGWLDQTEDWDQIQLRHDKPDAQLVKLLLSWLQSTETEEAPHSWEFFIKVVRETGKEQLAERIQQDVFK